jgi:hypothetical protein
MGWLDDREVFTLVVEALHPLNRDEVDRLRRLKPDTRPIRPYAGTIHGDQEPALKCRFYASPLLLIQCILEPLKDFFMGALRNLENDACFMQESAVHTVAGWLAEGKTTWSYDQGDATNNTPVKLAYVASTVIASLIHRSEVFRCFRWCNEARWLVSKSLAKSFGVDEITWSVGQPLGTGPSFGAYSVAHHALIRGICLHLGVPFTCYVILGDDIVICHEKVAAKYHELITLLGVPISLSKSFVSDKIAEFAGFTIQHNQQFRPGKWREVTGDSLLNLIVEPGYDYKRVVPKFWVPLIERMMSTPYPYGLASLDLTSLSDDELSDYALTCCLFFFKSFVPPDESEVENLRLFTDDLLSWEFFHETKLDQLIYGDQDDNRSPRSGGRTVSNACDVLRSRWRTESCRPRHFNYAPDGNLARLFWRPCEVSALFARATTDNKWLSESGRRSFTREQVSLFLKVYLVLPDGVIHTLNGMFSLINSFIRSYSPHMTAAYGVDPDTLVPLWISQTPFLRELYKDSLVEPSPLAVIRDLIAGFPYYGLGDFTHIPSTFISLIRRYARQKDVLPSNKAPMPHRNVGVGSKG